MDKAAQFEELLARRVAREPVQQIVGHTEFWSLNILCDSSALIPRPETEVLVETAVGLLKENAAPAVADIGTGTGCIAVALATELPGARICASDISRGALELAARNLAAHGLTQRVRLFEGDLAEPFLNQGLAGQFDAIVCNPPYIAESEKPTLQPEVRDYEPEAALYGGADGLRVIACLLAVTSPLLKPAGHLLIEIAQGQAPAVRELAEKSPNCWRVIRTICDPAGIERVLLIQKETP
jgi:release factor glutamine methyltransferase